MKDFLAFLLSISDELYDLFVYVRTVNRAQDPEVEKQLAMRIVRKASDERMKRELEGG